MTPAPLAVDARALLAHLTRACADWPPAALALVGRPLVDACRQVAVEAAVASSLPRQRAAAFARTDRELVSLRLHLALATDLDLLSAGAAQSHAEAADRLGRMLGGWRRHHQTRGGAKA